MVLDVELARRYLIVFDIRLAEVEIALVIELLYESQVNFLVERLSIFTESIRRTIIADPVVVIGARLEQLCGGLTSLRLFGLDLDDSCR